jgi:hypothetical protein
MYQNFQFIKTLHLNPKKIFKNQQFFSSQKNFRHFQNDIFCQLFFMFSTDILTIISNQKIIQETSTQHFPLITPQNKQNFEADGQVAASTTMRAYCQRLCNLITRKS